MALEDLLREAAAKGLTHLSLHPVHSEDRKTVYWRASATPSTMHKYVQAACHDPAEAVRVVLEALPRAPRRKPPAGKQRFDKENPPISEMPQRAVTAAVTEPLDMDESAERLAKVDNEWERFKV